MDRHFPENGEWVFSRDGVDYFIFFEGEIVGEPLECVTSE